MKLKNVKLFFCDSVARFRILNSRGFYKHMTDEKFLKMAFRKTLGRELDLENPKTLNEKLQWLKLYDRKPEYTELVDKYEVKKYISDQIGEEYVIPTLGLWENFDDIDFNMLPEQFVLKCTHDSGGVVICTDKEKLDIRKAKKKINRGLSSNYFDGGREWPYKNVKPRIIAEPYLENADGSQINDYKIQCFHGQVDNIMVCVDRYSDTGVKYHYFDCEWNYIPYCPYQGITADNVNVRRPEKLNEMIKIAEKLSTDFLQLRVDLYEIDGKVYFGELTFYTNSGFDRTITKEADRIMGEKLLLNK